MDELDDRILRIIENATTRENILSFFRVWAKNTNLSLTNALLVFEQDANAELVCGRNAWKALGRSINDDANSIEILYPKVSRDGNVEYCYVKVYSLGCTSGQKIEVNANVAFADKITEITGYVWEVVPETALGEGLGYGKCDLERKTFCISKECPKELWNQTVLDTYLDYVMYEQQIKDLLVKQAALYVLCMHWNIKNTIVSALFGRINRMSIYNRKKLLQDTYWLANTIIDNIEGVSLNFDEIAIVNELLCSTNIEAIKSAFDKVVECVSHPMMKEELQILLKKLRMINENTIAMLLSKKIKNELFSYPPVYLECHNDEYYNDFLY